MVLSFLFFFFLSFWLYWGLNSNACKAELYYLLPLQLPFLLVKQSLDVYQQNMPSHQHCLDPSPSHPHLLAGML
jgi:hypothetical protein